MRRTLVFVWLLLPAVAHAQPTPNYAPPGMTPPTEAPPLGKEGGLGAGISLELLDVGAIQAITSHGTASGIDLGLAIQIDLGPRLAFKLPIEIGYGGSTDGAHYGELAIVPGLVYRFRERADQTWVPYAGGGLRLGVASIGKTLVGEPLDQPPVAVACCHDIDWPHSSGDGHHADPYMDDGGIGASPELWGGIAYNARSWLSVQFSGAVAYERLAGASVVVARESIGARLTF